MVEDQIARRGVEDPRVLAALATVPRHVFVPPQLAAEAYADCALPIGHGQTISQPYIVGLMTELLALGPEAVVLEVGTGSGYQAAVLAALAARVVTLERLPSLASEARARLAELGCRNVEVWVADGWSGWLAGAPYDGILVAAAPPRIPEALLDQLAPGGRLVVPVGVGDQELLRVTRTPWGPEVERVLAVRFVPMLGGKEA